MLNKRGIFIPDRQVDEIIQRLKVLKKLDYFIINGDFFHEFSKIDIDVIKAAKKLIDFIKINISSNIIIIRGNHDVMIDEVFNFKIYDYFKLGKYLFTHGDKKIDIKSKITVIGHEHPAVVLVDESRNEDYKCFLVSKNLIVLPSFNLLISGHNVLTDKMLSPYLIDENLKNFEVFVSYEGEIKYFHKIKDLV